MHDYSNFEKVGPLGATLPTNDEQITTQAGDLILYQGSSFVIYYDTNSFSLTRLGKIDNVSQEEETYSWNRQCDYYTQYKTKDKEIYLSVPKDKECNFEL